MQNIKDLYILGMPIETPIGEFRFLKVHEFPKFIIYTPYIQLYKFEIINKIKEFDKTLAEVLNQVEFIEIIRIMKDFNELYSVFKELFTWVVNEDAFDKIKTDEEFNFYKKLIMIMNGGRIEEKSPNPEIQYFNELKKLYNARKSDSVSFESIVSSVWAYTGQNPFNLTIYQLYCLFTRISQIKAYDTTTLYSTISSEVKVEPWYNHIDMFEEEKKQMISMDELKQQGFDNFSKKSLKK